MGNLFLRLGQFAKAVADQAGKIRAGFGRRVERPDPFAALSPSDERLEMEMTQSVDMSASGDVDFLSEDLDEILPLAPPEGKPWRPAWSALMAAAHAGLVQGCERLCLWDPRLPKIASPHGHTALILAARAEGDPVDCVRALLPWSEPAAVTGAREGSTALIAAIFAGNVESALALIPASPLGPVGSGHPPLAAAAMQWEPRLCAELLAAGADPHWVSDQGETLLHLVASGSIDPEDQGLECAKLFLSRQALMAKNAQGKTPLDIAREAGEPRLEGLLASAVAALEDGEALEAIAARPSPRPRSKSAL